jgi:hypothetical protein
MVRKLIPRQLPTLESLHPQFRGFGPSQTAVHELLPLLRTTIEQVRGETSKPFYAQHTLARFFGVPQSTVHLVCKKLVAEGLLTCVRGSGTLVLGRTHHPRVPPRGVVGLPIWMKGLAVLPHWSRFFVCLQEALSRDGFVADTVFFSSGGESDPDFGERLLARHLDYCIWLYPLPRSLSLLQRLADGGVRTLAVVEQDVTLTSPGLRQYQVRWDRAFTAALAAWKQDGIEKTILVGHSNLLARPSEPTLPALAGTRMPYEIRTSIDPSREAVDRATGILYADEYAQFTACHQSPETLLGLMRRTRVLMKNSIPMDNPPPDVLVDIVAVEWEALARRLARDLVSPFPSSSQPTIIQARWFPRVPASRFATPA